MKESIGELYFIVMTGVIATGSLEQMCFWGSGNFWVSLGGTVVASSLSAIYGIILWAKLDRV